MGRPTDYDPAYCDKVIELGREGASKAEMAHALGCTRKTMDAWAEVHPEFLYSVKTAIEAAQGWWESEGRKATFGGSPGFNATSFIFNMKNRFSADWRDKHDHELTGPDGGPIALAHSGEMSSLSAQERAAIRQMVEKRAKPVAWVEGEPEDSE